MTTFLTCDVLPPARLDPLRLAAGRTWHATRASLESHRVRSARVPALVRGAQRGPLNTSRPYIELYVRWMQKKRRHRPITVSRRFPPWPASTARLSSTGCSSTPRRACASPTGDDAVADPWAQPLAV